VLAVSRGVGQDDEDRVRPDDPERGHQLEPVPVAEEHVGDDRVGPEGDGRGHGSRGGVGLADDEVAALREARRQAFT